MPFPVGEQPASRKEERVPQACLPQGAEWRTLQRYPEGGDKGGIDAQSRAYQQECRPAERFLSESRYNSGHPEQGRNQGEIDEFVPHHVVSAPFLLADNPCTNSSRLPAINIQMPVHCTGFHGWRTISTVQWPASSPSGRCS